MKTKDTLTQAIMLVTALYKEGLINLATYRRIKEKYA